MPIDTSLINILTVTGYILFQARYLNNREGTLQYPHNIPGNALTSFGSLRIDFLDRWQWKVKRDVVKKRLNFKDTRHKISVSLAMSTNLEKNMFQTFTLQRTRKKNIPGQILGQDRPEKNSAIC